MLLKDYKELDFSTMPTNADRELNELLLQAKVRKCNLPDCAKLVDCRPKKETEKNM